MSDFLCHACGECCGPVACTRAEWEAIAAYIRANGVLPVARDGLACMLQGGDKFCMVYPVRPTLCRMHGHVAKMPCPNNPDADFWPPEIEKANADQLPALADAVWLMDPNTYRSAGIPTTTMELSR